jgi:hypothetical protein
MGVKGARSVAIAAGETNYWTGKPCPRGHVAFRRTKTGECVECRVTNIRSWESKNPARKKEATRQWKQQNSTRVLQSHRDWHAKNPGKRRAYEATRRADLLAATCPFDAELFALVELEAFELADRRLAATGIKWHVDHTVPIRSSLVCGLHNEFNLRVITAADNWSKGNRHWPDMP